MTHRVIRDGVSSPSDALQLFAPARTLNELPNHEERGLYTLLLEPLGKVSATSDRARGAIDTALVRDRRRVRAGTIVEGENQPGRRSAVDDGVTDDVLFDLVGATAACGSAERVRSAEG